MNDCKPCGEMVAVKREPGRMREADVWFRYSWGGRSEGKLVKLRAGLGFESWVSIVSVDEIAGVY